MGGDWNTTPAQNPHPLQGIFHYHNKATFGEHELDYYLSSIDLPVGSMWHHHAPPFPGHTMVAIQLQELRFGNQVNDRKWRNH